MGRTPRSIEATIVMAGGGRPVRVGQAQGILIAALGTLAEHYGYRKKRP
jgi:hypothetical protein